MIEHFAVNDFDYLSNCLTPTFPDGLDVEIFSRESFLSLSELELNEKEKEHVTLKYRHLSSVFRIGEIKCPRDLGTERWTVDYPDDFDFVVRVFRHFRGYESVFSFENLLAYLDNNPDSRNVLTSSLRNISLAEGEEN